MKPIGAGVGHAVPRASGRRGPHRSRMLGLAALLALSSAPAWGAGDPRPSIGAAEPLRAVAAESGRTISVTTSAELSRALLNARPGDVVDLADGTYTTDGIAAPYDIGGKLYYGTFVATGSGTAANPIVVRGSRRAVIDGDPSGDGTGTQYGIYLVRAEHWRLEGFTVRNVSKGVVLDRSDRNVVERLLVHTTGEEGIHLRAGSARNVVRGNRVRRTGQRRPEFGEGIYVGSAESNWASYSDGRRDASDRNRLIGNRIRQTTAESIDVKEGTRRGLIRGNIFDGTGMVGDPAGSWIDVKGNGWRIERNRGTDALENGFEVHEVRAGWGRRNVFAANVAKVRSAGYGFYVQPGARGNTVRCDNVVTAASSGFANVRCRRR